MLSMLLSLLLLVLIFGLIYFIVEQFPLEEPFKTVARLIVLIAFLIILIGSFTGHVPYVIRF